MAHPVAAQHRQQRRRRAAEAFSGGGRRAAAAQPSARRAHHGSRVPLHAVDAPGRCYTAAFAGARRSVVHRSEAETNRGYRRKVFSEAPRPIGAAPLRSGAMRRPRTARDARAGRADAHAPRKACTQQALLAFCCIAPTPARADPGRRARTAGAGGYAARARGGGTRGGGRGDWPFRRRFGVSVEKGRQGRCVARRRACAPAAPQRAAPAAARHAPPRPRRETAAAPPPFGPQRGPCTQGATGRVPASRAGRVSATAAACIRRW